MLRWIPYTFVRTVLFFVAGILLGFYAPDIIPETLSAVLIVCLTCIYFLLAGVHRRIGRFFNPGWIGLPLVLLLGYAHLLRQTESRNGNHLVNCAQPISYFRAVITRFPEEKARTWKMEAMVTAVYTDRWQQTAGTIILYFPKADFPRPFQYGDILLVRGGPQLPEGPSNPGEFNYRAHLARKNIHHQHFVRKGGAIKTDYAPPNLVMDFAFRGRDWAERTLEKFVDGEREQAIASALVLGVTDGLDNELLNAYSATGSMHILAVSGLHVSIIYFILLWIFSPLNKLSRGRWLVAFISLAVLWLYALVTGLTPSVLRAVTMFSFLAVARPWARSTNVYNTLAVSAFCLLLFDPFLIFSVGFQLSYLAVLGIVYIYPRILKLWEPGHWLTVEIWKICAVSIAAQIATFPLGLLHFHQFPNYFLLSNLLVVPLSFVVLILGLVILGASFIPVVASVLGYGLEMVIRLLNTIVFTLEDFPFSMIGNVYINAWQCVLLLALIVAVLALFEFRKISYLVLAFGIIAFFSFLQWQHFFKDVNIRKVAIYKIPGHSAIDLMDRGRTLFIADPALRSDPDKIRYHVMPNRIIAGIGSEAAKADTATLNGGRFIFWRGKKILQVLNTNFRLPGPLKVDLVVIGNNAVPDVSTMSQITCDKVILDASNSFFFASRFLEAAKLYNLDVHSVLHQGAFIAKFENQDT